MSSAISTGARHPSLPDPAAPLTASGNLGRRAAVSRTIEIGATAAGIIAVALLIDVAYTVANNGAGALSVGFLTHNMNNQGIANALIGTGLVVGFGAILAIPIGVLTGLYLTEFAGPRSAAARVLKLVLDLLQGLPTVIVAIVVYGLIVLTEGMETGFAAAIALAIVILPLVARASQEVLQLVPNTLREAADALGVERWRTVLGVVLPSALSGIATGAILAIARAAGETAPVLICNSLFNPSTTELNLFGHGIATIPMFIFINYGLPSPDAVTRAWGAAFVLLVFILLANIGARVLLARSRAKMGS